MKKIFIFCFLNISIIGFTQKTKRFFDDKANKGKFFASFGWNNSIYTNSNIHFEGNDYKFTLHNVKATDRQSPFSFGLYFGPTTLTIPQVNFKLGYFFHNNYSVSINIDHMKYVVVQNQSVYINGEINNSNTEYNGAYSHEEIILKENFLSFEHTDGLNFVHFQINRHDELLQYLKLKNKWLSLNISEGLGLGILAPKTNAKLLGNDRNDVLYLSGYGFSANADLNLTLFQILFFEYGIKGGFIDMPYIKTTNKSSDSARQNFWFFEYLFSFGLKLKVFK